jgi:hypothetical protein
MKGTAALLILPAAMPVIADTSPPDWSVAAQQIIEVASHPSSSQGYKYSGVDAGPFVTAGTLGAYSYVTEPEDAVVIDAARVYGILLSYLDVEEGWDGYRGKIPNRQAVLDAIEFLRLLPDGMPQSEPMLASDGEVGLFWNIDGYYIDIGFYGDGKLSFHFELPDGKEFGASYEGVAVLPEELESVFHGMSSSVS